MLNLYKIVDGLCSNFSDLSYLDSLNPRQKEAVTHGRSPLLILAGAGSGKTRVITTRIAHLIDNLMFHPDQILAVTFTNKAAREMQDRVAQLRTVLGKDLNYREKFLLIKTFHSFCAWFLRQHATLAGLDQYFSIYDDEDAQSLLKTVLPEKTPLNKVRLFYSWISRAKDDNLTCDCDLQCITHYSFFPEMFRLYEEKLAASGNIDFGGLIQKTVQVLVSNPSVKDHLRQRFQAILVDEYQDCNGAQSLLLQELYGPQTWLTVVGDDDQSIYGFRGADVNHILQFPQRFPDTCVIRLEQNYRSTGCILDVASQVVAKNQYRTGKTLWTENDKGTKPIVAFLEDQDQEASWVAKMIKKAPLTSTAVLYRTNAQSRAFESRFIQEKIPYSIVGTVRFYEREEIKDVLAWLKFLNNARDTIAFERIINKPTRGIGQTTLKMIALYSNNLTTLIDACGLVLNKLRGKAQKGIEEFLAIYHTGLALLNNGDSLAKLVTTLIDSSRLGDFHSQHDATYGSTKGQNLSELVNAVSPFSDGKEGLCRFLESIELDDSFSEKNDKSTVGIVTLITMHNTKGLEFDRVFITGLEEGLFPREESFSNQIELEEERRLFYVAITRARKELMLTSCRRRLLHGHFFERMPSLFLSEMDSEYLDYWGIPHLETDGDNCWARGQRVYHDDFGVGSVVKKWYTHNELVIDVRFDSGQVGRFIPAYTSLERVSDSD